MVSVEEESGGLHSKMTDVELLEDSGRAKVVICTSLVTYYIFVRQLSSSFSTL